MTGKEQDNRGLYYSLRILERERKRIRPVGRPTRGVDGPTRKRAWKRRRLCWLDEGIRHLKQGIYNA